MNIQNLANILKESGQTRAIMTLDTTGDDAIVIINIPTASTDNLNESQANLKLRAALSKPLCVMGKVDDINDLVVHKLTEFGEEFSIKCTELSEPVTATKKPKPTAQKATQNKATKTAKTKPVEPVKVVEEVDEADALDIPDMNLDFFKDIENSAL